LVLAAVFTLAFALFLHERLMGNHGADLHHRHEH
jgi:hypothetical protein